MDSKKRSAEAEAIRYLTARMKTIAEVSRHLKEKGYDAEETEQAISELKALNYLDDYRYALTYFEHASGKRRGEKRIKKELSEKGVSEDDIDRAFEDFVEEYGFDEEAAALEAARGVLRMKKSSAGQGDKTMIEDDKVKAAVARKLDSLGYSSGTIYRVFDKLRFTEDEGE